MPSHLKILISHAYDEKELAKAWKTLLDTLSNRSIEVWFSSDLHAAGGVPPGADWHLDLERRLQESTFVLAIQTASSLTRTWIMWECGIAHGIYGRDVERLAPQGSPAYLKRGIIPISFSLERGRLLNPLNMYQVFEGDNEDQVRQVCTHLLREAGLTFGEPLFSEAFAPYIHAIQIFRPRKMATEQEMSLWRERFERLIREGLISTDLLSTRTMMYTSLGPDFKPLDLALHDMLSSLLLDQEQFPEALDEIESALQLARDDLRLLHRKTLAQLELKQYSEAEATLQYMFSLNNDLRLDPEIGSLQGRIYREHWSATADPAMLTAALRAYYEIYQRNKRLYFPGINAAALLLQAGSLAEAEAIFEEILQTCLPLQVRQGCTYWIDFTIGEAYLGLGKIPEATHAYLTGVARHPEPSPRERDSAIGGIRRVTAYKKLADEEVAHLLHIVRGEEAA